MYLIFGKLVGNFTLYQRTNNEEFIMAALEKFSQSSMVNQLRHIEREIKYPKNADIDFNRSKLNYSLAPKRKKKAYDYLKERLSELDYRKQENVRLMVGWVVTAPRDMKTSEYEKFFQETYNFLIKRYGEENCVQAVVHKDESGEPHLHFYFIPVVKNTAKVNPKMIKAFELRKNHPEYSYRQLAEEIGCSKAALAKWFKNGMPEERAEKVSARERIDKLELQTFHPDLQQYLNKKGVKADVHTGITKKNGRNYTVAQLKELRDHFRKRGLDVDEVIKSLGDNEVITINEDFEM